MYFIPVVNPDGVAFIEANETGDGTIVLKRKNGRSTLETFGHCDGVDKGVDLNRNYDVSWSNQWSYDNMPCGQSYRGAAPFSEPETRSMRDFILEHKDELKFIINYHSYGNMYLVPYSGNDDTKKLTPEQKSIYDEITSEAKFPDHVVIGSAYDLLNYSANGEAADWALAEAGIIAMSPELASENALTMTFDIPSNRIESRVILKNMGLPTYLLEKATAKLEIEPNTDSGAKAALKVDDSSLKLHLKIVNKGMTEAKNVKVVARLEDFSEKEPNNLAVHIESIAARSTHSLDYSLDDVSPAIISTLSNSLQLGSLVEGRMGLNVQLEVSIDGRKTVDT